MLTRRNAHGPPMTDRHPTAATSTIARQPNSTNNDVIDKIPALNDTSGANNSA